MGAPDGQGSAALIAILQARKMLVTAQSSVSRRTLPVDTACLGASKRICTLIGTWGGRD